MITKSLGLLALVALLVAAQSNEPAPPAAAPGPKTIEATLDAVYDVISGPAGERDWDRFRALFHPAGARLMSVRADGLGADGLVVMTPDDYVARTGPYFAQNAFYETELAHRVERFGRIAQVFSTYESRREPDAEPFARGINSFQLYFDGERWWVCSILWDQEAEGRPIPEEYAR